jgi:hypothetical protein
VSDRDEGVSGVVLDASLLISFSDGEPFAMVAVDEADRNAQALLVPAVALTSAYAQAGPKGRAPYLDHLLDLGVVVVDGALGHAEAPMVGTVWGEAPEVPLPMAEAAWHARRRDWVVLTVDAAPLREAYPDVRLAVPGGE